MLHSFGIDGTIKSPSLEGRLRELVSRMEEIEKDTQVGGKNSKKADCITSASNNSESEAYIASCQCYVMFSDSNSLEYPDVYVGAGYVGGAGSEAINFNHALAETALAIYKAEGNRANNPNNLDRRLALPSIDFLPQTATTPANHNAILKFEFNIPINSITTDNGTIITAKEYLSNG